MVEIEEGVDKVPMTVGDLSSVDSDPGEEFKYQLVDGEGDTDNNKFQLSYVNQLVLVVPADYNDKKTYSIRLESTDTEEFSFEKIF